MKSHQEFPEIFRMKTYQRRYRDEWRDEGEPEYAKAQVDYFESISGLWSTESLDVGMIHYYARKLVSSSRLGDNDYWASLDQKALLKYCHQSSKNAEIAASALASNNEVKAILNLVKIYKPILNVATKSAAYSHHIGLMNQLIEKGASLDAALEGAAIEPNFSLCKELIDRGANRSTLQKFETINKELKLSLDIIQQLENYYRSTSRLSFRRDDRVKQLKIECIEAKTEKDILKILEKTLLKIETVKKDEPLKNLLLKLRRQIVGQEKLPFLMASHSKAGGQSAAYGSFFHNEIFERNLLPLIFEFAKDTEPKDSKESKPHFSHQGR